MTWLSRIDGVYKVRNGVATNNVETALGRPNAESRSMGRETQSGRYWKRNREETFRYVGGKDMTGASVSDVLDKWEWRHTSDPFRLLAPPLSTFLETGP